MMLGRLSMILWLPFGAICKFSGAFVVKLQEWSDFLLGMLIARLWPRSCVLLALKSLWSDPTKSVSPKNRGNVSGTTGTMLYLFSRGSGGPCNSSYCTFQTQPFSTYTDLEADCKTMENAFLDVFGVLFLPLLSFRKFTLVEKAKQGVIQEQNMSPTRFNWRWHFYFRPTNQARNRQECLKWLEWLEFESGPLQLKEEIHVGNHHPWKASSQCSGSCVSLVACLLFYETKQLGIFAANFPGLEQQTACLQRSAAIGLTVEFAFTDHVFSSNFSARWKMKIQTIWPTSAEECGRIYEQIWKSIKSIHKLGKKHSHQSCFDPWSMNQSSFSALSRPHTNQRPQITLLELMLTEWCHKDVLGT